LTGVEFIKDRAFLDNKRCYHLVANRLLKRLINNSKPSRGKDGRKQSSLSKLAHVSHANIMYIILVYTIKQL
jgi:hypothetical protein